MDYDAIEDFVASSDAPMVRTKFDSSVDQEKEYWELAIMVWIANGGRQDLENEFPDLSGANPTSQNRFQLQSDTVMDCQFTTVGELKKILAEMPDTALVSVSSLPSSCDKGPDCLAVLTTTENDLQFPAPITPERCSQVTSIDICETAHITQTDLDDMLFLKGLLMENPRCRKIVDTGDTYLLMDSRMKKPLATIPIDGFIACVMNNAYKLMGKEHGLAVKYSDAECSTWVLNPLACAYNEVVL